MSGVRGKRQPGGDRDVQPERASGGMDAFIREIAGYIRFYESYEDILNPYIYRRGRRQGEQIICSVIFHEKGERIVPDRG